MNIAVVDCYDSFTYNLVHYLQQLANSVQVFRNDELSLPQLAQYNGIVLSPGPGLPIEKKNLFEIIELYAPSIPILGICLGHQAIGEMYGLKLINLPNPLHGISVPVKIIDSSDPLFKGFPATFEAGRYHSWAIRHEPKHSILKVTAVDEYGMAMAFSHLQYPVSSVQFHPESVLTPLGFEMLRNWVEFAKQFSL